MAANIQQFYNQVQTQNFARVFQFRLESFGTINPLDAQQDLIYVETTSLPGKAINNIQVPYMGMNLNVPGTISYPGSAGYNVVFRCDQGYNIRAKLEENMRRHFDDSTSTGNYNTPTSQNVLSMALLDNQGNPVRYYSLFGAYVQALTDVGHDIKDGGTIATINATIAYQFWRSGNTNNLQP